MSRKNVLPYKLAIAQSLSASFNSAPTVIKNLDNISYQINLLTTNSIGTFAVQCSNDYEINSANDNAAVNPGTWVSLTLGGGTPFVNAANDSIIIDLNQLPYSAIRVAYTSSTPGTGTCDIYLLAKTVGA